MSIPRPESRISELESEASLQRARIRELSEDMRADIKILRDEMHQGFEQAHAYIQEHIATKEDLATLKATQDDRFNKIEATQVEHGQMLKEILARLPKQPEGE